MDFVTVQVERVVRILSNDVVHALAGCLVKYAYVVKLLDEAHVPILVSRVWASFLLFLNVDDFLLNSSVRFKLHGISWLVPLELEKFEEALVSGLICLFVTNLRLWDNGN